MHWQKEVEPDYRLWARQHSDVVKGVLSGAPHMEALWTMDGQPIEDVLYYHAREAARYALAARGE